MCITTYFKFTYKGWDLNPMYRLGMCVNASGAKEVLKNGGKKGVKMFEKIYFLFLINKKNVTLIHYPLILYPTLYIIL